MPMRGIESRNRNPQIYSVSMGECRDEEGPSDEELYYECDCEEFTWELSKETSRGYLAVGRYYQDRQPDNCPHCGISICDIIESAFEDLTGY